MTVKKKIDVEYRQKGAKKAQKELNKLGGSIQSTIMKYAAFGLVLAATTRFLGKATKAYGIQEDAEMSLRTALGRTSFKLLEHASALQKVTRFGDEQILTVMASIGAFIKDEDQIKKATQATLDLATATRMDLNAAGQLVAKTLGSTTDALNRYGVSTKGAVGSTERLDSLTRGIANVWENQATEAAKTLTGQIDQLGNVSSDTMEKIGAMIGIVSKESGIYRFLINTITSLNEAIEEQMGTYINFKNLQDVYNKSLKDNKDIIDEVDVAYQTWAETKQAKIDKDILELEYLERWNKEHPQKMEAVKEMNLEIENYNSLLTDSGLKLEKVGKIGVKTTSDLQKRAEELGETWRPLAEQFVSPISGAFQQALTDGTNVFTALGDAFERMLIQMVSDFMARAAIFGFLSLVTGIPFMDLAAGSLPGFQHGGSFQVGGSGGADSQVVAFKATPGERVDITPPGGSQAQVINNNFYGTIIGEDRWIRDNLVPKLDRAWNRGY